jgi:hypothetical protein
MGGELAERGALPQRLARERRLGPRVDAQIEGDLRLRRCPIDQEARRRHRRATRLEPAGVAEEGLAGSGSDILAKIGLDSRVGKFAEGDSHRLFENSREVSRIAPAGRVPPYFRLRTALRRAGELDLRSPGA